jgi:FHS family L-fucose permease-like MFS transporter
MAIAAAPQKSSISAPNTSGNLTALSTVTTLFFMWGFITVLNDVLIPHLKAIFDLNYKQGMLIQFAFFGAYFLFSLPSGKLIEWVGYKRTMIVGLLVMACGALLFLPAASVPSFPLFLTALIILAAGITALQVAANAYVAVLGKPETASSRTTLAQAINSVGTFLAPQLGHVILAATPVAAAVLLTYSPDKLQAYRIQEASSVKLPYLCIALTLVLLAVLVACVKLPKLSVEEKDDTPRSAHGSIWRHKHLVLGVLGIFLYVGAEVSIGSFLANYLNQKEIGNLAITVATSYISFYWGGAMIGRFIGAALLRWLPEGKLLGIFALAAGVLVATSMLTFGPVAVWTILSVGLFNSIMFPTIFAIALDGLGPLTGEGSGLLITAIVGGAIIPLAQGALADTPQIGIHHAFILPVLCYLYIAFYGFSGSNRKPLESAKAV